MQVTNGGKRAARCVLDDSDTCCYSATSQLDATHSDMQVMTEKVHKKAYFLTNTNAATSDQSVLDKHILFMNHGDRMDMQHDSA